MLTFDIIITNLRGLFFLATCLTLSVITLQPLKTASANPLNQQAIIFDGGNSGQVKSVDPQGNNFRSFGTAKDEFRISPDGTKAVYSNGDLIIVDLLTDIETNITNSESVGEAYPHWSSDGSKILFAEHMGMTVYGVYQNNISTVNYDGTEKNVIISQTNETNPYFLINPSWSPDNTKIITSKQDDLSGNYGLMVIATNGNVLSNYGMDGEDWIYPSWSPDGTKIVFTKGYSSPYNSITVINNDGTEQADVYIPAVGKDVEDAVWSPDSSRLVFDERDYASDFSNNKLLVMDKSTGELTTIYEGYVERVYQWWTPLGAQTVPAPDNLYAVSPTKIPSLSWSAVSNATAYNIYRDGSHIGTTSFTTFLDDTSSDGIHSYYVTTLMDALESDPSNEINVLVDNVRPLIAFTAPLNFTGPFIGGPTVSVSASDTGSELKSLVIHVYKSSGQLLSICGSANSSQLAAGAMSCSLSSLPAGSYYLKAGTFDNAGNNKTITSSTFIVL